MEFRLTVIELPAYSGALHPQGKCWAWSGRSSKVAIRSIDTDVSSQEGSGEASTSIGRGVLGGTGKLIDTGKGKFGMDLQFVSFLRLRPGPKTHWKVARWTFTGFGDGDWTHCRDRHRNASDYSYIHFSFYGCSNALLVTGLSSEHHRSQSLDFR